AMSSVSQFAQAAGRSPETLAATDRVAGQCPALTEDQRRCFTHQLCAAMWISAAPSFWRQLEDHRHSGEHFGPPRRRALRHPRGYLGLLEKAVRLGPSPVTDRTPRPQSCRGGVAVAL